MEYRVIRHVAGRDRLSPFLEVVQHLGCQCQGILQEFLGVFCSDRLDVRDDCFQARRYLFQQNKSSPWAHLWYFLSVLKGDRRTQHVRAVTSVWVY